MDIRILDEDRDTKKSIVCSDRPADGNACHKYQVVGVPCDEVDDGILAKVNFQKGPVEEVGVNGCQNEDLLIIIIDRLEHFQEGQLLAKKTNKHWRQPVQHWKPYAAGLTTEKPERGKERPKNEGNMQAVRTRVA